MLLADRIEALLDERSEIEGKRFWEDAAQLKEVHLWTVSAISCLLTAELNRQIRGLSQ